MCGIAGVVNTDSGNAVSPEIVRTMNDVIRHRGPDEDGFYVASVPTLPGCHTQARTLEELEGRIAEAIELCLEDAASEPA